MKKIKNILKLKNKINFGIKKNFNLVKIGSMNKKLNIYDVKYKDLIQFNKLGYNLSKKFHLLNIYYIKQIISLRK